jgi:hypothetical protein
MSSGQWVTWCEVQGVECDVVVSFDASPPEPDVNWGGDLALTEVSLKTGGSVINEMTEPEFEALQERVDEYLNEMDDPREDYGDYLYDQKKDREAEERE